MKPRSDEPPKAPAPRSSQRRAEYELYKVAFAYVWAALNHFDVPERDREDLVQEILFAAYAKRRVYEPERGSLARWLHGFVVNFAHKYWEQQPQQQQVSLDEVPERLFAASGSEDPGRAAEQRDFLYKELLAKIPFDQRAVVIGRDLEGLEFKDIAEAHQIPLSTAYDRYTRGHVALELAYERWKRKQKERGLVIVPLTLAQIFAADRPLQVAPVEVERAVWKRLQRTRRWAPVLRFLKLRGVRAAAWMAVGAALYAACRPTPHERVSVVQVPVLVPVAAEVGAASAAAEDRAKVATAPPLESAAVPVGSAVQVSGDPLEEQRLFDAASRAFRQGDQDAALASLQRLARAYPHGALASEREQLWVQVLVGAGRGVEARARIDRLRGTAKGKALVPELEELVPGAGGGNGAPPER